MTRPSPRLLALASLGLLAPAALAGDLYFVEITPGLVTGHISTVKTDGTGYKQIVETGGGVRAVAYDPVDSKMYWTDVDNYVISRAKLDGSGQEDVILSGLIFPSAIAIDSAARTMYWLDQDVWLAKSNLDGTDYNVISETVTHRGVDVDHAAGKVYWSTSDTMFKGKILRSNFDGSQVQIVVRSGDPEFKPSAIALDIAGGKIYWTDYVVDLVCRSNMDGTNIEILWAAGANHNPRGITLDLPAGKMYWGQDNDFEGTSSRIMRANLDGTSPEIVIDGIGWPNYIFLVSDDDACAVDLNGDGVVDFGDYLEFLNLYDALDPRVDFNHDGVIDFGDYLEFLNLYDAGC